MNAAAGKLSLFFFFGGGGPKKPLTLKSDDKNSLKMYCNSPKLQESSLGLNFTYFTLLYW